MIHPDTSVANDRGNGSAPDVDVLVIGAGPVGLAMALQLGRYGLDVLVAERHASLSRHPKASGMHARTMEIFRQWGLADRIRAAGLPPQEALGFGWMTRLSGGIELGSIMLADEPELLAEFAKQCAEPPCFVPQDTLEPILADALTQLPSVELRFGCEAVGLEQDTADVTVTLQENGTQETVRARYVVAADGVRSRTRAWLSITETAAPSYGESVNVHFEAPGFDALRRGRPYFIWWIVNGDTQGAFWPVGRDRWIYNFPGDTGLPDEYFSDERCSSLVRKAAGQVDLDVKVLNTLRWDHEQAVADTWRRGRVLLVGDAAHRFPPHGGFGANSGIQDAANLAWKLAAVLHGRAGEALLDTYEAERKPVAEFNAEQCTINTKKMEETGWLTPDPADLATIEEPEGAPIRDRIAAAIPAQREQFHSQGQQFGTLYESSAVISDGRQPVRSTVSEYRMTSTPGARAPHAWFLDKDGNRRCTVNLLKGDFVLLAGPSGADWLAAAKEIAEVRGVRIEAYLLGHDLRSEQSAEQTLTAVFEIGDGGAVLIRPDGHIGFRAADLPANCPEALNATIGRILSRP